MAMNTLELLLRALERRDHLTSEEREIVAALPTTIRNYRKGEQIVAEGSRPTESCLVLEGLTVRAQYTAEGKRQITAIHVPGDFVDLHGLLLKVMDHNVLALSDCRTAFIPHDKLREATAQAPHLARLLWLSTLIDAAIQRAWITSIGRRSSEAHLAHLLCELYVRLETVELARDLTFQFPATQEQVADMIGLSVVHVNRTIQALRATRLLTWQGATITIADFGRFAALADFDPTYLNLFKEPR